MENFQDKISNYLASQRKSWAPACNYAFNSGHPCARHLVYCRLNWQEKLMPSPTTLLIFREGEIHEKAVLQLLSDSGIQIVETQRPFEISQIQLRGKIDGQIKTDEGLIPAEIKSMNPNTFSKIDSIQDMLNHKMSYVRGYVTQMQIYLFGLHKEKGLFILKNKVTGELKFIECPIDYEYAEKEWKKLELVNMHVAAGTYPERIEDRSECKRCDFRHICLPDEVSETLNIEDSPELLEKLEVRNSLENQAKQFERIDKEVKEIFKQKPTGAYLIGGKYQVETKTQKRTEYVIPKEIKEQYKGTKEIIMTDITPLNGTHDLSEDN